MTAADRTARPPEPHPELDTLADLDADVLAGAEAERVRAHAASCARCGQVLAALGGVRADLSALPAPPLPPAVAARLDATLADLRTAPAERPAPAAAKPPAPVVDLAAARERRWRRLTTAVGATGAAAALVLAGVSITSLVKAGSGSDDSAAGGGGTGTVLEQPSAGAQREDSAAVPGAAAPTSLPDFDRSRLQAELPSLTAAYAVGRVVENDRTGPAGALADGARRAACARAISGAEGEVTAVGWIRYAGRPAYVLVFVDDGVRTAYVVGEECGQASAVPATVLDTVR